MVYTGKYENNEQLGLLRSSEQHFKTLLSLVLNCAKKLENNGAFYNVAMTFIHCLIALRIAAIWAFVEQQLILLYTVN